MTDETTMEQSMQVLTNSEEEMKVQRRTTNFDEQDWNKTEFFLADHQTTKNFQIYIENWDWQQFAIFTTIHLIYNFLLGPFIIIILFPSKRGRNLYFNLQFAPALSIPSVVQFLLFGCIQLVLLISIFDRHNKYQGFDVIYLLAITTIRAMVVAGKYASFSEQNLYRVYNTRLGLTKVINQFYTSWINLDKDIYMFEVTKSLLRENVDMHMFYFEFYLPLDEELKVSIAKIDQELAPLFTNTLQEYTKSELYPPSSMRSAQNQELVHGYSLLYQLNQKSQLRFTAANCAKQAMAISLIRQVLIIATRFSSKSSSPLDALGYAAAVAGIILGTLISFFNFFLFLLGITDLVRKNYLLVQAGQLLLLQKSNATVGQEIQKVFPTLNIFCAANLRSWSVLRILIMDYGYGYHLRYQAMLSWFTILGLAQIVLLVLNALGIRDLLPYQTLINIYDVVVMQIIILIVLYQIAQINEHFRHHKTNIQYLISTFQNIRSRHQEYFDPGFSTNNPVYMELRNRLLIIKEDPTTIAEHLDHLVDVLNGIMDTLDIYNEAKPYKLLGFKVDMELFISITLGELAAVIPAIFAIVSSYLQERNQ